MPKFKFTDFYDAPVPPVDENKELFIEAENETQAWAEFRERVLQPIEDAFICEKEA